MRILGVLIFVLLSVGTQAQFWVRQRFEPPELVDQYFVKEKSGIRVLNVKYMGSLNSIAYFLNKTPAFEIKSGLLLTTGFAQSASGRNLNGNSGAPMGYAGDRDLSRLVNARTNDAAVLLIEFESYTDSIEFKYFFGSEEYPEYVNKGVNDVFAFFIRKVGDDTYANIAHLPDGTPVTVDNINKQKNKQFYIENGYFYGFDPDDVEADPASAYRRLEFTYDGFTTLLTATATVEPFVPYELKIAIADVGDDLYDSGVFLQQGSFQAPKFKKMAIHDIEYRMRKMNIPDGAVQTKVDNDTLKIVSRIEFDFNQHAVSQGYHSFLDSIAAMINDFDQLLLRIDGHTDAVGADRYNEELSYKRALSIADYLVGKGVARSRMVCYGFGSSQPVSTDDTDEARAKNRRVEFKISQVSH